MGCGCGKKTNTTTYTREQPKRVATRVSGKNISQRRIIKRPAR